MPSKSRKRVTRSGKGAFSLYLPKKWIDEWSEEQSRERKVDLLEMDDHLIISPVRKSNTDSATISGGRVDEIRQFLLCTYVRGYEAAELNSKRFSDEQICAARNFMRLLDENMILDVNEDRIGYGRSFKVNMESSTISQMQQLLFEKIQESMRLATELIQHFDTNPRRSLHLLKMMRTLEEEDIDRLAMQIFRRATRMEFRFDSFADLFFVVMATDLLERMGDGLFDIARSVCRFYDLDEERLLFPLDVILEDVDMEDIPVDPSLDDMRQFQLSMMDECGSRLRDVMDLTIERKGREAYDRIQDLEEFNKSLAENLNLTAQGAFGTMDLGVRKALLRMMEIGESIMEIGEMIRDLTKEIAMFYFCEGMPR
jgi:hypothetical protein